MDLHFLFPIKAGPYNDYKYMITHRQMHTYTHIYACSHKDSFAGNLVSGRNSFAHKLIMKRIYVILKSFRESTSKRV